MSEFRLSVLEEGSKLIIAAFPLQDPVVVAIILPVVALHHVLEKTADEVVVRLLLKLEVAAVCDKLHELFGSASRQLLNRCLTLLLTNFVILLILVLSSQALPRKSTL